MHPTSVQLFIEAGADDLPPEEDRQRRATGQGRQARRPKPGAPAAAAANDPPAAVVRQLQMGRNPPMALDRSLPTSAARRSGLWP